MFMQSDAEEISLQWLKKLKESVENLPVTDSKTLFSDVVATNHDVVYRIESVADDFPTVSSPPIRQ